MVLSLLNYRLIHYRSTGWWTLLLFLIFLHPAAWKSYVFAAQKEKYLTKDYIDNSIERAFYVLTEAASVAGVGFRQKEAIEESREIATNLKHMAKGDPNERYVRWKVGELEAQIYLEERDLMLQDIQKGQESINQMIARYNAEVGKPRPDFATLKRIHIRMGRLDIAKGNQMAGSFNKRYRDISREVLFSLEKAIVSRDMEKARDELGYCLRNKSYLSISESKYASLEDRVEGLTKAHLVKPIIESEINQAFEDLNKNQINRARDKIKSAGDRFAETKLFLPGQVLSSLSLNIDKASRLLCTKEDSLVDVNISILNAQGFEAADDYLQEVLRPCGVSIDKIAIVDKAILSISSPEDNRMSAEIGQITSDDDTGKVKFDDMLSTAKKKARQKMDSIRIVEDKRMREELDRRAREDRIAMEKQRVLQEKYTRAEDISVQLYTLLEKKKFKKVKRRFKKELDFLKKYMRSDAFELLSTAITQPQKAVAAVEYIQVKEQTSPPKAPMSAEEKLRKNKERAQMEIMKIYEMLESNNLEAAYQRFSKYRAPLQKYLQEDAFNMLENTVNQAYNSQLN